MIHIDGDIYIDADDRCYSLVQRRIAGDNTKEPGKEYIVSLGKHYTTLSNCLSAYVRMKQRRTVAENDMNLTEAIDAFRKIEEDARKLFKELSIEGSLDSSGCLHWD